MGINERIMTLQEVTGYPVEQDEYEGTGNRYIVFSYEDERGCFWADDTEKAVETYLQVSLFVPKEDDYLKCKKKVKKALQKQGFQVESIQTWLEKTAGKKIRRITFSINTTEAEE